jgi:flagellar protein FlaJ
VAYRLFGPVAAWTIDDPTAMRTLLETADIQRRPDMHLAMHYAGAAAAITVTLVALVLAGVAGAGLPVLALLFALGLTSVGAIYGWAFQGPRVKAYMRGERIDEQLPFAVNYMASMAKADVTPEQIVDNLSRQPVYGEVTAEAQRIRRDVEGLNLDLVTALQRASDRAPSPTFHDFLQGFMMAVSAGGSLEGFLDTKAEQFMANLSQDQEAFLETLGVVAESYVTVVLAGPLFVIVLLTVLVLFGAADTFSLDLGYVLMLLIVPLANVGFAVSIDTISPGT